MLNLLKKLKQQTVIAYVGGSDLAKQQEQLGANVTTELFDFGFSENGATAFRLGELISQEVGLYFQSLISYLGEDRYRELIEWCLHYLADLKIPKKRGTFLELRAAMLNVCPIGRNCTYEERLEFYELDCKEGIRTAMVQTMREKFADFGLQFSIGKEMRFLGGQISIDVFPVGWDKTYCLKHLQNEGFVKIHFFGDKTEVVNQLYLGR